MAKSRHNQQPQETTARGTLAFLTIGALLVAGLVVWALTRTVEPAATSTTADYVSSTQPVTPPQTTATSQTTSPTTPIASSTAGIATTSAAPVISGDRKEVARISAEDLNEKVKAGSVTVVDVRDAASYATDHIPGALHIPMASVEANLDRLPKGKPIVTYCT
jgi:Rhodanese-like domain